MTGQIVIYRPSIGPGSLRDAFLATFVGNHRESSGESRLRSASFVEDLNQLTSSIRDRGRPDDTH